ncbi:MAG: iron chelate uptake ABC transporter family permease subunit [Chloroflexota bacterium]
MKTEVGEIYARKRWRQAVILAALLAALALTMVVVVNLGPVDISVPTVAKITFSKIPLLGNLVSESWSATHEAIVMDVRLPRILAAVLIGSALATAGCAMQGMFRNPMASPYIVGVSSGAAFGAALAMVLGIGWGTYAIPTMAFVFATLAVFIVYNIARVRRRVPVETLLLAGIAVGSFFSALVSFMNYIAGEKLPAIVFWLMGGLWASDWDKVIMAFPPIILGMGGILLFNRDLNLMLLGEEQALDMGVNVERVKQIILVFASLVTASAVCISGIIGFVGLIIPHIMRILVGPDHRILLPSSCLAGAMFLIWTDTLARTVIQPTELPVGIITALFGAPFFLFLLRRRRRVTGW